MNVPWTIYVHDGRVVAPATSVAKEGTRVQHEPVFIGSVLEQESAASAIENMLSLGMKTLDDQTVNKLLAQPKVIVSVAGIKKLDDARMWSIDRSNKGYSAYPIEKRKGEYLPNRDKAVFTELADVHQAATSLAQHLVQLSPTSLSKSNKRPTVKVQDAPAKDTSDPGQVVVKFANTLGSHANSLCDQELAAIESELGESLPSDYRYFVRFTNGWVQGTNQSDLNSRHVTGLSTFHGLAAWKQGGRQHQPQTLDEVRSVFQDPDAPRISLSLLAISADAFGNPICIGLKGKHRGKIYLCDHEDEPDPDDWDGSVEGAGNVTKIADSFEEFVSKLKFEKQ